MGEVVHLSFGPQANNLNADFYNLQGSYFVYTAADAAKSLVNPRVRFSYGKTLRPRAVFWDFRNGLGRHQLPESCEDPVYLEAVAATQDRPVTSVGKAKEIPSWTDRMSVFPDSSILHEIPGWEVDPVNFPFGRQRGAPAGQDNDFALVSEGVEQFSEISKQDGSTPEDYLDLTFRPTLEKCDQLGGVNIVTDFAGWAGFAGAYLELLRDDFIPKNPIFTWAISRQFATPRIPLAVRQSRFQALATFSEFSSLVIPLQDSNTLDLEANAASHIRGFETMCLMSSLRKSPVSMYQLSEELTIGSPGANIIQMGQTIDELKVKSKTARNKMAILRSAAKPAGAGEEEQESGTSVSTTHWCPQPFETDTSLKATFELNDAPLNLRKLLPPGNHELRELIYDLTDKYMWHWEDDSGDSDV